jgi:outer membrane receptor protein involved in Fe transport
MGSRILFSLFALTITTYLAYGQGSISGTVKDATSNEPVIGANVIVQGLGQGASTDIEGKFHIKNVPAGTYSLEVSFITYKKHMIPNVVVEDGKKVNIDIPLSEDVSNLEEIVVTGSRQTDTDFELIRSIKEAKLVVVGITAEQISKTLDRDAAQVLRRVPGVTIKDNQFIQVRGLSERYNAVMLHNAYAPSVETDIRSFSFATLPSSQIDRMLVFKSPAADIPGDFAGGVVKIFTKSVPDENSVVLDYSTQYRVGTTFSDYYHQKSNGFQNTGFNDKYYNLPANFPSDLTKLSESDLVNPGRSMKNDVWTEKKGTAIPDQRFTLTFNRKFNIRGVQVGNITAVNYSNTFATYNVERGDFTTAGNNPARVYQYFDKQYNQQVRTGFLFNWAFKFNDSHTVEFKNLYNQTSNDQFVSRTGFSETANVKNGAFDKQYRGIYSGQLLGTHQLFQDRTTLEWIAGYNNSYRDQPDYKRYQTNPDPISGTASIIIPNQVSPNYLGRFFSKLNETAYSGGLSVKQRFGSKNPLNSPELKAGLFFEKKDRSFNARNIGYVKAPNFNPDLYYVSIGELFERQNINSTTGIEIAEATKRSDSYAASNQLFAYYVMGSVPLFEKIKIDAGVRIENNTQKLDSYDPLINSAVHVNNPVTRVLPSANVSYNFTERMLIRGAYGETLNRPEFRELAPFAFFDFNYNFLYFGNSALKTAKIQNVDLRWEYYPSKGEQITFGGFYKKFTDPIEAIVDASSPGGGVKNVTFGNAQEATSYGAELEIKKSLNGLTSSSFVDKLNVLFNGSVIHSRIKISEIYATSQNTERPLQGQAPYVLNAALFYADDESGWQVNLLYNVVGKSIAFVGNFNYADVYLMPRNVVDLTISKKLSERFTVKGGISDILNQPMLFLQDGNQDGKFDRKSDDIIQSYKPGQVVSLGFTWRAF